MKIFKRSFLYVVRKKAKTLLLFLVFLAMGTGIFSGVMIHQSTSQSADRLAGQFRSSFRLQTSFENATFKGEGIISQQDLEEILTLDGIEEVVLTRGAVINLSDTKSVPLGFDDPYDRELEATYGDFINIEGTSDTAKNSKFVAGTLTLTQGRHLTKDDVHGVLVHERFAKQNHLSIGDHFRMSSISNDPGNRKRATLSVDVTVVGIFSGQNSIRATTRYDMFEHIMLTDLTTILDVYDETLDESTYSSVDVLLKSGDSLQRVMKEAKKLDIDWVKLDVLRNDQDIHGISASVKGVFSTVKTMIVLAFLFGVVILTLILMLWLHGRKKEAGILISMGLSKANVIAQYLLELSLVAILAFGFSWYTGNMVANAVGEQIVTSSAQQAKEHVLSQGGGMIAGDADSALWYKTLDYVELIPHPSALGWVYLLGAIAIVISVLLSSLPLLKRKPKELLVQLS